MYQSFTGSSRRQRQVNLSGRPTNPFASTSLSAAQGPQSAVANAHADRVNRAQQREKLQASSRIQRIWRGHNARRKTFKAWRQMWDDIEERGSKESQAKGRGGAYSTAEESLQQLNRLMLFYSAREDVQRLTRYGMRQIATNDMIKCEDGAWPKAYSRLEKACISALLERKKVHKEPDQAILTVLAFSVRHTQLDEREACTYYEALTATCDVSIAYMQNALLAPLQNSSAAYAGLAVLLARPLNSQMLRLFRASIDTRAFTNVLSSSGGLQLPRTARSRLWLLGNSAFLADRSKDSAWTAVFARLLGSLADDVDFESTPIDMDNTAFDQEILSKVPSGLPLNAFLSQQVNTLINQEAIRNLLVRDTNSSANAQLLAEYALTLLRCFPRRADDIRMWLYLGPTRSDGIPATQYFWDSVKAASIYLAICHKPRNVVTLLRTSSYSQTDKGDWTITLVFLELYTFILKVMDDEEFMGIGRHGSAIPIAEVADLITFLKNLGFVLVFNAQELNGNANSHTPESDLLSLRSHFGKQDLEMSKPTTALKPMTIAGLPGLTTDYLKGLVTGILRAIYERDSRRHFLPADHWLMTSRFDMASFIPGVVAEEESRRLVQNQDDDDKDNESDEDDLFDSVNHTRPGGLQAALRAQGARARWQRKASQKRYLESVAPRLEILQNMPFFIPFITRVEIFRQFVQLDQQKRRNGFTDPELWRQSVMFNPRGNVFSRNTLARHHAKIRRKNEFNDAFEQFYDLGTDLKEPIQITFVDEFDIPEAGIDGGGVTKEFLTSVIAQAFDPARVRESGLQQFFVENDKHLLYPNPTIIDDLKEKWKTLGFPRNHRAVQEEVRCLLQQYEFLGRIIGKCLYEGILVDVSFAGFFLKKWALTGGVGSAPMESGYRASINDLRELDEDLYKGLLTLKSYSPSEVESLGLNFTVDDVIGGEGNRRVVERELVPNGADTPVTSENRLLYINRMSRYRLQDQSRHQTHAFLKGLSSIIQPSWLNMFNQSELQTLIGGAAAEINVADLRRNTTYGGTYVIGDDGREHPSVQLFWSVMMKLPDADRRAVLKFVTSTPRGPLLGFGSLNPPFSIRDSGSDENRFPTTSTCVNLLKLPMYRSEKVLREKLLAAVNSGAGFDLS